MHAPNTILIESFPQLIDLVRASSLCVVWFVRCEIGPDWIGGGRDVQLLYNGKNVVGEIRDRLISVIITAASIPSQSNDSVIHGEGEILWDDNRLMLDFKWHDAVPYGNPHGSGQGRVELVLG